MTIPLKICLVSFTFILSIASVESLVPRAVAHDNDAPNSARFRCPQGYLMMAIPPPGTLVCQKPGAAPITRKCSPGFQLRGSLAGRGNAFCMNTFVQPPTCPRARGGKNPIPGDLNLYTVRGRDECRSISGETSADFQNNPSFDPECTRPDFPHSHYQQRAGADRCKFWRWSRPASY